MNYAALYRLSGMAAVAGGALRIATAFPLGQDAVSLEWLYTCLLYTSDAADE